LRQDEISGSKQSAKAPAPAAATATGSALAKAIDRAMPARIV